MASRKSRVQVNSTLTAVSSKPTEPGLTHPLSASDLAMGLHTLHVIFYYEENAFTSFDLDPVRICLSELLSFYPPVTGRMTRNESGRNWEVKCNDAGVRIVRAKVGAAIDEWLRSAGGEEESDLTVWEDMPGDPTTWSPFRIQINEFEGGGLAIGLSCTHMLADPTSLTLLFKSWTEVHRRQTISSPPSFSPPLITQADPNAVNTESSNYFAVKSKIETQTLTSTTMATATFKFSHSAFKKCLEKIQGELPDATPFDVFAALFWTRVAHIKRDKHDDRPDHDQMHSLSICVDFRRLLKEPLSYGFFGNALHFSSLSLSSNEMGLGHAAQSIHNHMVSLDDNEVRTAIEWFESQKSDHGGRYPPPFKMYGPDLICINMEHMVVDGQSLMYHAYFENMVRPIHVNYRIGNAEGEGLILMMPSPEEEFSRTVAVTLPEEEMKKLLVDQDILRLEPKIILCGRM